MFSKNLHTDITSKYKIYLKYNISRWECLGYKKHGKVKRTSNN